MAEELWMRNRYKAYRTSYHTFCLCLREFAAIMVHGGTYNGVGKIFQV